MLKGREHAMIPDRLFRVVVAILAGRNAGACVSMVTGRACGT